VKGFWIDYTGGPNGFDLLPGTVRYIVFATSPDEDAWMRKLATEMVSVLLQVNLPPLDWMLEGEGSKGSFSKVVRLDRDLPPFEVWRSVRLTRMGPQSEEPDLCLEFGSVGGRQFLKCAVGRVSGGELGSLDGTIEIFTYKNTKWPTTQVAHLTGDVREAAEPIGDHEHE
jgi:hypothetical protein